MIGALWTGISGLSSHQTALDNESHNISNVNTVGYKSSRISFADQMYQDKIGKGSKVLDAEKLYVQGNLKLTGVDYDMAISGDGFFTVLNNRSSGTSENLYTRAGNFRMGDNGTLQDAAGNEVQGWAMRALDASKDVVSTNPNTKMFTSDYTKLLTSKVVSHSNYIETITAKATDYSQTAKADSETIFSGAGGKSKSAKISDVEALVSNYSSWLQKLQDEPDGGSASSIAQISQVNFKSGGDGLVSKEGDQVYVYIDGTKYSQNYVSVSSDLDFRTALWDGLTSAERTDYGLVDPSGSLTDAEIAVYDKEASRIETYKALADQISEIPGLRAFMAKETGGTQNDVLESDEGFDLSTDVAMMTRGIIRIDSLIPGESFSITEVGEISGSNTVAGNYQTTTLASEGEGVGALQSVRDALSKAITGKQQDIYTESDLGFGGSNQVDFIYSMTIYDKEFDKIIPIPGNSATTPATPLTISIPDADSIDDIVDYINGTNTGGYAYLDTNGASVTGSSYALSDYIVAKNINGNLVIETLDSNYDVEFSSGLKYNEVATTALTAGLSTNVTTDDTATFAAFTSGTSDPNSARNYELTYNNGSGLNTISISNPTDLAAIEASIEAADPTLSVDVSGGNVVITSTSTFTAAPTLTNVGNALPIDKNSDYSGRQGAGAEFIELVNTIDQTTTQSSLQLKLDTLGISDSAFGEFSVDSTGLITMKQDGAEFAIGQVSIALFNNNRGLEPAGDNLLSKSNESGEPIYNLNNDKTAKIEGKTLELSTADLSESLVNLMVFQRAFEANAKSITTSDQLLNTLINLKR